MEDNLILDAVLQAQISNGTLGYIGTVRVAAGRVIASLFPDSVVYLNPQQQGTETPAFFFGISSVKKTRRLGNEFEMLIGFELLHLPRDALSNTERLDAVERIAGGLSKFQSDLGEKRCPEMTYDNEDGEFVVKGAIRIGGTDQNWGGEEGELIQNAVQTVFQET